MEKEYTVLAIPYSAKTSELHTWAWCITMGNGHMSKAHCEEFDKLEAAIVWALRQSERKIEKVDIWDDDILGADTAYLDGVWQFEVFSEDSKTQIRLEIDKAYVDENQNAVGQYRIRWWTNKEENREAIRNCLKGELGKVPEGAFPVLGF